jgi:hypothetical protein
MVPGSGVTNSLGVRSGLAAKKLSGVTSGVDLLFGSDYDSSLFIVYILLVLQKTVYLSFVDRKTKSH